MSAPAGLRRRELYPHPVVDGSRADGRGWRWQRRAARLLVSNGERQEAKLEARLAELPAPSRPNVAAVVSPKGGVGKTTSTLVIGGLLADRLRLRVVALDANPDFGTLAALAPEGARCARSLADLLTDIEEIETATQLRGYVTALASGLHLLGAPVDPQMMAGLGREAYGELLALLGTFYDLVLLDLGTGVAGELAQFAVGRADQVVLVTTPEWVTSSTVLAALDHLEHDQPTVAVNKLYACSTGGLAQLEQLLAQRGLRRTPALPYDGQLAAMLDTATYQLDSLRHISRVAIKRLGLAVAEQLV